METLDCIKTRRSVHKYRNIKVEQDKIARIIDAAAWAPSSGNVQNWKFLIIDKYEKMQALADACQQQYWIGKAPVAIIVVSEPERAEHLYGVRGKEMYSRQNASAAIQNILLAANDQGLGSCWIGSFDEQAVKDISDIPDNVNVEAVIALGYSAEEPEEPSKYVLYDMVYFNSWDARFKDTEWSEKDYAASVWGRIFEEKDRLKRNKDSYIDKAKESFKKLTDRKKEE